MGTSWHIRLTEPENFDRYTLLDAIEQRLEDILAQMSHWRGDSVLGQFNSAGPGEWTALPDDFAGVMSAAFAVAEATGGAFDPAIGALVDIWGHGPMPVSAPPSKAAVAEALGISGWQRLQFDHENQSLQQPGGLRLDLSGIAKGYAVDALATLLRKHGCNHFLVEIGGELAGSGMRPDGDPWWVDLETPVETIAPLRLALHQLAVATSGDYVRGRHTVDPRSGYPVEHAMSVSVVHRSAMLADAWATAICVESHDAAVELATRRGLAARTLFRTGDEISEWISPALAELMTE
nr:FAD:protein FMN transferase [Novosphingobium panipatense]